MGYVRTGQRLGIAGLALVGALSGSGEAAKAASEYTILVGTGQTATTMGMLAAQSRCFTSPGYIPPTTPQVGGLVGGATPANGIDSRLVPVGGIAGRIGMPFSWSAQSVPAGGALTLEFRGPTDCPLLGRMVLPPGNYGINIPPGSAWLVVTATAGTANIRFAI